MRVLSKLKKPKVARILGGALGFLLVLSLILMPAVPALAGTPIQPHQFEGTVTIGTGLAPEGTIVSAKINGIPYESGTVDAEGRYGYDSSDLFMVPADDSGTPDKEGGVAEETVKFYITNEALGLDEVKANETAEFEIWGVTELNLTVDDTMAPTVSLIELTPDPNSDNTPTFTGTATDTLNNISLVEYKVDEEGAWTEATASDGTFDSKSEDYTFTTAELTDGAHTVYVRATDAATNTNLKPYVSDEFVVITYQITDLAAIKPTQNSIDLTWTTPATEVNRFSYFDARYSKATITSGNWDEATRVVGEPVPAAGASQEMKIRGLDSSTTYYFAMKLVDEKGFVGLLSNIASVKTLAAAPSDEIPPAWITDLAANPGSPATTRVILLWTAPGDDEDTGTATSYEIRRSTSAITDANWSSATKIYNNIVPQAAGGSESFVARLTPNRTYYFAIQAKDEVGNASLTSNSPPVTTKANLPTIDDISPTSGENSEARMLIIDGTNFVDGTDVVRFGSGKNTFDLTNVTYGSETQLTAEVPKGAPTGTYKVRVVNDNGTSKHSLATYEVTEASIPLPVVTNLIPQMAASNTPVSGVKIFGKNLAGATGVSFGDTEATSFTVVSSGTKITVDLPGLSVDEYDVKVTTPDGTNEISGVKFVVSAPVAITEDTTEDTTTSEVVKLDTNVIPVQLTLTTDTSETATQVTDVDVEIEVTIPPQTTVTCENEPYTGNINPPRVVKPDESVLTDLSDDAVVIEMGNPEETIYFDQDFVATVIITAPVQPVIWYYNKTTHAYELAGKTGTKDGVDYVPGGTKLGQEDSTYTMGLLLDHMSAYVAGVEPHITSAPATVTAGSAFTITGTNFHPTAAEVYFNGTAGTIVSRTSTTQIRARFSTAGSYTLKVENPDELSDTRIITLTTPLLSPVVTTGDATSVTITSAGLNGNLDSLGTASSVAVSFEWGETTDYGNTATVTASPLSQAGAFSADLSNLSHNTTYYFRTKAMGDGTRYGDESSFTTVTITFTITATAGEGGTISPSGEVVVNYDESETFTITPDTGYEIADVLVDGESIGAEASYLFENVTADHTIHATFALETFTITATAGEGGTISPSGEVVVNYGASETFTITPDTGYEIADVLVDGASVSVVMDEAGVGNYTFENVVADHSISANFTEIPVAYYTLTVTCDPTEGGSVSLDPEQPAGGYAADTSVELTAIANEGYDFGSWSGDLTGSTNPDTITMDSDKEVIANFAEIGAPAVTTDSATSITTTLATLNGSLTDLGTASSVAVSFEWGETTDYGNFTAAQTMTATGSFTAALSGLSPNTSYHFRARAVGDGTGYGVDRSFTTRARPAGGGGIGPRVPPGTTDVRGEVSSKGVFEEPVTAFSDDELCTLTIPEGTVGLTEDLEPLDEITILTVDEPPAPPEDADIVLAYDLGPDGATFEPAITLTFSYDPADIPEGKDVLVVAYYDETAEAWVYLEGVVDPVTNTITVSISHFTCFAIIARAPPPPAPAAFSVTNLSVKPLEVEPKEVVTISLSVANTGGMEESYTVVLKINGVKEVEKSVTIAAGKSKNISFSVAKEKAGSYSVAVDGLSASFTVVAPPEEEEEVAPPEEEEEVPEVKPPFPWPLVGGIIGGVVVVGLCVFFWIRRREVRAWLRRYRTNG